MSTGHGFRALGFTLLFVAALAPATARAADCLTNPEVKINGQVYNNICNLLGSPSGLAGNNGGITIEIDAAEGEQFSELWVLANYSDNRSSANLFPGLGSGSLDCDDFDIPEAVYLDIGGSGAVPTSTVWRPRFGGAATLGLAAKCLADPEDPPGGGIFLIQPLLTFIARSTDIEGDGDTDEADENSLRAAIGTGATQFDLNFDSSIDDAGDLPILITEAKRRVILPYGTSAWASEDCYHAPCPEFPCGGSPVAYTMFPPAAPVVSLTVLNATTTRLSWPAVADDQTGSGASRPASGYEVRRSSAPITAGNWDSASIVTTVGPGDLGTTVLVNVSRPPNTSCSWYYAVKAKDDVDNLSAVSNSPADQIDVTAPATITNLSGAPGGLMVRLNWTAPGDDGSTGTASLYDVRYTVGTGAFNWATATAAAAFSPAPAGFAECIVVDQLQSNTNYKFAVKTRDDCGNWSAQSNVFSTKTKPASFTVSCDPGKAAPAGGADGSILAVSVLGSDTGEPGLKRIRFDLPRDVEGQPYDLSVFDVPCQQVSRIEAGTATAGEFHVDWRPSAQRLAAGFYIIRLRAGGQQATTPLVLQ